MNPLVLATIEAYEAEDPEFVERTFRDVLRRPADDEARERALAKLADGRSRVRRSSTSSRHRP